jgi:hypothetical protein
VTADRTAVVVGSVTAICTLLLLFPRRPRAIQLTEQRIELGVDADRVFQQLTSFDQGPTIFERSGNHIIAEFPISVGWYHVTTLERVTLDPNRRRVTFEQLRSPFFTVRTATEVFELSAQPGGGSLLTLRGALWPRLGFFGWLITQRVVRPRWDDIDARFLARLRERASLSS